MKGHSMTVPGEVLENLHDAIDILKERRVRLTQPMFIEYLFATKPEDIADIVYENYMKQQRELSNK